MAIERLLGIKVIVTQQGAERLTTAEQALKRLKMTHADYLGAAGKLEGQIDTLVEGFEAFDRTGRDQTKLQFAAALERALTRLSRTITDTALAESRLARIEGDSAKADQIVAAAIQNENVQRRDRIRLLTEEAQARLRAVQLAERSSLTRAQGLVGLAVDRGQFDRARGIVQGLLGTGDLDDKERIRLKRTLIDIEDAEQQALRASTNELVRNATVSAEADRAAGRYAQSLRTLRETLAKLTVGSQAYVDVQRGIAKTLDSRAADAIDRARLAAAQGDFAQAKTIIQGELDGGDLTRGGQLAAKRALIAVTNQETAAAARNERARVAQAVATAQLDRLEGRYAAALGALRSALDKTTEGSAAYLRIRREILRTEAEQARQPTFLGRLAGGISAVSSGLLRGLAITFLLNRAISFSGNLIDRFLVDPIERFVKGVFKATDEFRKLRATLTGVVGSPSAALSLQADIFRAGADLPITAAEAVTAVRGVAFQPSVARTLQTAAGPQRQEDIRDLLNIIIGLATINPDERTGGVEGAGIALRELLGSGNPVSLRRRFDVSPATVAGFAINPRTRRPATLAEFKQDPEIAQAALAAFTRAFVGPEALEEAQRTFEVQGKLFRGLIQQFLADIGERGAFDNAIGRLRRFNQGFRASLEAPEGTPGSLAGVEQRLSDVIDRLMDRLLAAASAVTSRAIGRDVDLSRIIDEVDVQGLVTVVSDVIAALSELAGKVALVGGDLVSTSVDVARRIGLIGELDPGRIQQSIDRDQRALDRLNQSGGTAALIQGSSLFGTTSLQRFSRDELEQRIRENQDRLRILAGATPIGDRSEPQSDVLRTLQSRLDLIRSGTGRGRDINAILGQQREEAEIVAAIEAEQQRLERAAESPDQRLRRLLAGTRRGSEVQRTLGTSSAVFHAAVQRAFAGQSEDDFGLNDAVAKAVDVRQSIGRLFDPNDRRSLATALTEAQAAADQIEESLSRGLGAELQQLLDAERAKPKPNAQLVDDLRTAIDTGRNIRTAIAGSMRDAANQLRDAQDRLLKAELEDSGRLAPETVLRRGGRTLGELFSPTRSGGVLGELAPGTPPEVRDAFAQSRGLSADNVDTVIQLIQRRREAMQESGRDAEAIGAEINNYLEAAEAAAQRASAAAPDDASSERLRGAIESLQRDRLTLSQQLLRAQVSENAALAPESVLAGRGRLGAQVGRALGSPAAEDGRAILQLIEQIDGALRSTGRTAEATTAEVSGYLDEVEATARFLLDTADAAGTARLQRILSAVAFMRRQLGDRAIQETIGLSQALAPESFLRAGRQNIDTLVSAAVSNVGADGGRDILQLFRNIGEAIRATGGDARDASVEVNGYLDDLQRAVQAAMETADADLRDRLARMLDGIRAMRREAQQEVLREQVTLNQSRVPESVLRLGPATFDEAIRPALESPSQDDDRQLLELIEQIGDALRATGADAETVTARVQSYVDRVLRLANVLGHTGGPILQRNLQILREQTDERFGRGLGQQTLQAAVSANADLAPESILRESRPTIQTRIDQALAIRSPEGGRLILQLFDQIGQAMQETGHSAEVSAAAVNAYLDDLERAATGAMEGADSATQRIMQLILDRIAVTRRTLDRDVLRQRVEQLGTDPSATAVRTGRALLRDRLSQSRLPSSDDPLIAAQESADEVESLLGAVERLSGRLRESGVAAKDVGQEVGQYLTTLQARIDALLVTSEGEAKDILQRVRDLFPDLRKRIEDAMNGALQAVRDFASSGSAAFETGFTDALVGAMHGAADEVEDAFSNMGKAIERIIANTLVRITIIQGIINPLFNAAFGLNGTAGALPTNAPIGSGGAFVGPPTPSAPIPVGGVIGAGRAYGGVWGRRPDHSIVGAAFGGLTNKLFPPPRDFTAAAVSRALAESLVHEDRPAMLGGAADGRLLTRTQGLVRTVEDGTPEAIISLRGGFVPVRMLRPEGPRSMVVNYNVETPRIQNIVQRIVRDLPQSDITVARSHALVRDVHASAVASRPPTPPAGFTPTGPSGSPAGRIEVPVTINNLLDTDSFFQRGAARNPGAIINPVNANIRTRGSVRRAVVAARRK